MNWISKLAAMSYELHSLRLRFATELCTASPLFIYNCIRKKTKKAERERERERERDGLWRAAQVVHPNIPSENKD